MLSDDQKRLLIEKIERGEPLPAEYRRLLFARDDAEYVERTGVYTLEYKGKAREQDILADTPGAPLQEIRSFNADSPHAHPHEDWRNLLIYGDNLLALKALYEDQRGPNRFGTRNRIKLIYIDPPFATKQDFMKDREKAYRDKLIGAQFIEFLRKRLILLRELLADDGSIYVHLDQKKGHYIKAVLDEVFGEHNFRNEIVWIRTFNTGSSKSIAKKFPSNSDSLYFYTKSENYFFQHQYDAYSAGAVKRYDKVDEHGRRFKWNPLATVSKEKLARLLESGEAMITPTSKYPVYKHYFDSTKGAAISNVWNISGIGTASEERLFYPTQKPEALLERLINASSRKGDIVLDAFSGSGSTIAAAEKLDRCWIGIDCGRLAIYTGQKRLLNLNKQVGAVKNDDRREHERVEDFSAHSKSGSKAALLLFDKAAAGELEITDALLTEFAAFLVRHCPSQRGKVPEFSLLCREDKLTLHRLKAKEDGDARAGQRVVEVGGVRFLISFIEPKQRSEPARPLKAKHFALLNAGVYDRARIRELNWSDYKPFVMQLFGVREDPHPIHAFQADGYIGADAVHVWNYPEQPELVLDEGYIDSLHEVMRGMAGERFYIIAPVSALDFMADEIRRGNTRYIVLKVPESVIGRLLASGSPGALRQPMSEGDVNAVIDAVGFDFVSQPLTEQRFLRLSPPDADLTNAHLREAVVRLTTFRAKTLTTDPEDFPNFSTLSMVMVDPAFDGDVFSLGTVLWGEDLVAAELKRLDMSVTGDHATKATICEQLDIRIPEEQLGARAMVILVDQYGNEKRLEIAREEFIDAEAVLSSRFATKKVAKNPAKRAAKSVTRGGR